jgi:hypothetical protein
MPLVGVIAGSADIAGFPFLQRGYFCAGGEIGQSGKIETIFAVVEN